MEMFSEVKGYVNRTNAVRKMEKMNQPNDTGTGPSSKPDNRRWFILALPNGRFAPCVHLLGEETYLMTYYAHNNVCVIG